MKTTISISEKYAKRLRTIKNHVTQEDGSKMRDMDDVMEYLLGQESNSKEEDSNSQTSFNKPLPFQTQETPDPTRSDTQLVARTNQPEGFLSNSK